MLVFVMFINLRILQTTVLQNSFPLSDMISFGNLCLQTHLLKRADATVSASLFESATSSTYFEKASVIHMMYFSRP